MSRFVAINLAGMDPPDIIETLDFETILAALKADMSARMAALGLDFDVVDLESDPAVKILETAADREVILRARVNGAAKALLLALAHKMDLEHLGAWFGVERLVINQAEIDTAIATSGAVVPAPIYEDDERLRRRVQLAPQAFSTAGPYGAYMFHALTAAPTVKSVGIVVPEPGKVVLYPLVTTGDGRPSPEVLDAIRAKLLEDDVRPLTDVVTVTAPTIIEVPISVTLVVKQGPDVSVLTAKAKINLMNYASERHKVGAAIYKSGIYQAAQVQGVEHVLINAPLTDIDPGDAGAIYVPSITVNHQIITDDSNLLQQ